MLSLVIKMTQCSSSEWLKTFNTLPSTTDLTSLFNGDNMTAPSFGLWLEKRPRLTAFPFKFETTIFFAGKRSFA
jgi:hypothetical protein